MKYHSTIVLKIITIIIGAAVGALCLFVFPNGIRTTHWDGYRPILLGMYVPAIPFFIALYHALKLLTYIEKNKIFSPLSIHALTYIKYCAFAISALYALGLPYIYIVADKDDAPGVMLLGCIFTFAPLIIGVFSNILQEMLQNAIRITSESDLTI